MKARLVSESEIYVGDDSRGKPLSRRVPAGHVIDRADSWKLVRLGKARPADEECARAAGMTEQEMQAAIQAQARISRGILPEDWAAFDRGEMDGYDADGNPIPGPNAAPTEEDPPYQPPE
jgi:hypothetical protein